MNYKKKAKPYFNKYGVNLVYVTEDGNVFLPQNLSDAQNYRSKTGKKLKKVTSKETKDMDEGSNDAVKATLSRIEHSTQMATAKNLALLESDDFKAKEAIEKFFKGDERMIALKVKERLLKGKEKSKKKKKSKKSSKKSD